MRTLLLSLALWTGAAAAQELDEQQLARYQALSQELRCLVCQNQAIAESNAPLAEDLRQQVRAQILAGKSDPEIEAYVSERYGDFVLYRPRIKSTTLALWFGPGLLVLLALALAWRFARRPRAGAAGAVDAAKLKRILDDAR